MRSILRLLLFSGSILAALALPGRSHAAGPLLIAYGGHNETMAPIWVGIEKGIFLKYGVDPRALQTRSGPIMMSTLASGGVPLVWAAPSSALNSSVSGFKLTCFAAGNNRIPRELVVRKGIESLEDLRGKSFGVQSIGGGFWLSTMGALHALGIDPDKYKLNMRVLGDTGTVTQALVTGNVDAMVVPYSYAEIAKRAGASRAFTHSQGPALSIQESAGWLSTGSQRNWIIPRMRAGDCPFCLRAAFSLEE